MPELIDKEKTQIGIALIAKHLAKSDAQKAIIGRILFMIDHMPTIEPEVRHGRWIEESTNEYYCSYCGKYAPIAKNMRHCDCSKWCKECGAKMDGGVDNGD